MPNSNSLNSLLLPEARCSDDTIGTLPGVLGWAKLAFGVFFSVGIKVFGKQTRSLTATGNIVERFFPPPAVSRETPILNPNFLGKVSQIGLC
ncbi:MULTISPECIES: hypothetical protein [Herbaspirillum]|uniref:Uncharacterized protein n=1 Tax=Herbaspirillum frisingense TaxID=92645 RepID=A0ABU1PGE8_9BURK|nr:MULTISPECIES: hypothetical protein [Herbaspirillum]MDR6584929.1 hypothetical protein [Herbaspirillum frisingense]UIN23996.1 hypothetical protein LAZ82_02865 [Herbaspirillum frisingense]